jgi:membrane protein
MKWDQDNCPGMAAALSYYALFSLFPLLLIILSIIGSLIGPETDAFQSITTAIQRYLPPEVHELVKSTIITMNQNSSGAGLVGFLLLLFTASVVFAILKNSFNKIWQAPNRISEVGSVFKMALFFVMNKLLSFVLVFATGSLLLFSLATNIAIRTIIELVNTFQTNFTFIQIDELQLTKVLQITSSYLILSLAACILFKFLPTVYVAWGDVWLSALLTALILVGLQQLVGNSIISIGGRFLSYGVIGSVMILMMWIYLTCQIILFGCVFSYVYAHLFGSRRHGTRV